MTRIETQLFSSRVIPEIPQDKKHALACELVRRAAVRRNPKSDMWTVRQSLYAFGAAAFLLMLVARVENGMIFSSPHERTKSAFMSELGIAKVPSSRHTASAVPLRISIRQPIFTSWWQVDRRLSAMAMDFQLVVK